MAKLNLCDLCHREYGISSSKCPLKHCSYCGSTNLQLTSNYFYKDPIFIFINLLFVIAIAVYLSYENTDISNDIVPGQMAANDAFMIITGIMYIISITIYFAVKKSEGLHICKNCKTNVHNPITNSSVVEYSTRPRNLIILRDAMKEKLSRKDIISLVGGLGSILTVILYILSIILPKSVS